jgi:hypothetical protein
VSLISPVLLVISCKTLYFTCNGTRIFIANKSINGFDIFLLHRILLVFFKVDEILPLFVVSEFKLSLQTFDVIHQGVIPLSEGRRFCRCDARPFQLLPERLHLLTSKFEDGLEGGRLFLKLIVSLNRGLQS